MTEQIHVPTVAAQIPTYAHPGDAGADLRSTEALELAPGERALVSTGVSIALPDGYVALVCPRSGLAVKQGVTVLNGPGVVDAGYRGEIKVPLINLDPTQTFSVSPGDRIAQLMITPVTRAVFTPVETLSESARGSGGFGSTGVTESLSGDTGTQTETD